MNKNSGILLDKYRTFSLRIVHVFILLLYINVSSQIFIQDSTLLIVKNSSIYGKIIKKENAKIIADNSSFSNDSNDDSSKEISIQKKTASTEVLQNKKRKKQHTSKKEKFANQTSKKKTPSYTVLESGTNSSIFTNPSNLKWIAVVPLHEFHFQKTFCNSNYHTIVQGFLYEIKQRISFRDSLYRFYSFFDNISIRPPPFCNL